VGFVGTHGRGTPEYCGVEGRVDILTGTLGKALGGASGGYIAARKPMVDWLRQRSRPYLFSNTLSPSIVSASLAALKLLANSDDLRARLRENTAYFRSHMTENGFQIIPGVHPIAPVMLGDAALASRMADALLLEGIYVIGFSFPVVPKGAARIRVQLSAAHSLAQVEQAVKAFQVVGKKLGVIQ
jgi:glycine C-acetyltransferase